MAFRGKTRFIILGILVLTLVLMSALAADASRKTLNVTGTFNSSMEKPQKEHTLAGTLTPAGDKEWKAEWYFKWDDKATTWTGTVKGDLMDGKCSGNGSEGKKDSPVFCFEGVATKGVVQFNSAKIMPDNTTQAMGTGSFSVK
jgi:hypothetical protein